MKALLKLGVALTLCALPFLATGVIAQEDPIVVEASKAEGSVLVYSNLEPEFWAPVLKLFNAKYSWIRVDTTNMGGELWERYYAESSTKARTADVILTAGTDRWLEFVDKGQVAPYVSTQSDALPAWSKPSPGLYTAATDPLIIAYNRFLIPADKAPASVADIAKLAPAYKGKISTYDAAANPFGLSIFWAWQRNRENLWPLMEQIGPSTRPERSAGTITNKLISGEYAIGMFLSGVNIPKLSRPEMAKIVGWAFPKDGTILSMRGLAVTKAASSPNSAKLLLDHILSREGQIALGQSGVTPYRPDVNKEDVPYYTYTAIAKEVGENNILFIDYDRSLLENREAFVKRWSAAFKPAN